MEDKQLERLYDYTKFHIGIYLSSGGGLAALISAAAQHDKAPAFIACLIGFAQEDLAESVYAGRPGRIYLGGRRFRAHIPA
jgi:hypothetical protein